MATQSPSHPTPDIDDPADVSVALVTGRLSRAADTRELPSGDTLVVLEVTSRRADGAAESVPVVWLAAPAWASRLAAGERVVVAGRVRRRFYRAGGVTASRTEVVAERVAPLRQRARSRAVVESVRATVAAPVATAAGPVG